MANNFLQCKDNKTEVLIIGSLCSVAKLTMLGDSWSPLKFSNLFSLVTNLGVLLDSSACKALLDQFLHVKHAIYRYTCFRYVLNKLT